MMLLALLLAIPPQPPPEPAPSRSLEQVVRADLGIASAVGFVGISYGISPVRHLLLELGAGYGRSGLQLSAMPKLLVGSSTHRLALGFGASVGIPGLEFVETDPVRGNFEQRRVTPWLNLEAGYDYRSAGGFSFAASIGLTKPLSHGCASSIDDCVEIGATDYVLPEFRVGFGRWF